MWLRFDINSLDTDSAMKDPMHLRELLLRIFPRMREDELESLSAEFERVCDQSRNIHMPNVIDLRTKQGLSDTMARLSDEMVKKLAVSVLKLRRPDSKFVVAPDVKVRLDRRAFSGLELKSRIQTVFEFGVQNKMSDFNNSD